MSLSNSPKDTLTSLQVVLDLVEMLKTLSANPDISSLAKSAYALSESEQKKAEEARKAISDNQAVLAQIRQEQGKLDSTAADLEEKRINNKNTLDQISEENRVLSSKKQSLDDFEKQLQGFNKTLDERQKAVEANESRSAENLAATAKAKKESEAELAKIKARLTQIQEIAGA